MERKLPRDASLQYIKYIVDFLIHSESSLCINMTGIFLIIFFFFAFAQNQWTICFNTAVTSVFLRGNDQIWRLTLVVMGKYVEMRKRYKRNDLGKR